MLIMKKNKKKKEKEIEMSYFVKFTWSSEQENITDWFCIRDYIQ